MPSISYKPSGPVGRAFMESPAKVRGIRGPLASGKSVTCAVELVREATLQVANKAGVRKTRWGVVRNTNPELRTTTIKTWREWFDDSFGKFRWQPPFTHYMNFQLPDGTVVDAEVIFVPLDRPKDVRKLLSMDLTGGWINEAREVPKEIVDALDSRIGRYPPEKDGGCARKILLMDTNAPPEDHWWGIMAGDVPPPEYLTEDELKQYVKPAGWEFFSQPPAILAERDLRGRVVRYVINPERENKAGIRDDYYLDMIPGKSTSFINVYLLNEYASLFEGKPVYPTFRRIAHVAEQPIEPTPGVDVIVGLDFGRTPAAILCQLHPGGRWAVLGELLAANMGAKRFCELLKRDIARRGLSHFKLRFYGDPSGDDQAQSDEMSPFMMFGAQGIHVRASTTNDPAIRVEAVEQLLDRMVDGGPAFVVDPRAKNLIAGFEGGYRYKRNNTTSAADQYEATPDKNRFSNPHDALQYAVLGGGEGRRVLTGLEGPGRAVTVPGMTSPFERRAMRRGHSRRGFAEEAEAIAWAGSGWGSASRLDQRRGRRRF